MSKHITFTGTKGGVGTTTIAAISAILLASEHGQRVKLVVDDVAETIAILGATATATQIEDGYVPDIEVGRGTITVVHIDEDFSTKRPCDVTVHDLGTSQHSHRVLSGTHYIVTDNSYPSLRKLALVAAEYDRTVVRIYRDRALQQRDVQAVAGNRTVTVVRDEPAIARAIDAGLLVSSIRLRELTVQLDNLLSSHIEGALVNEELLK